MKEKLNNIIGLLLDVKGYMDEDIDAICDDTMLAYAKDHRSKLSKAIELAEKIETMSADELIVLAQQAEQREFKAAADKLTYTVGKLTTWSGTEDVMEYVLPHHVTHYEPEETAYDERPAILCNFDSGPVDVKVMRIINRNGHYALDGDSTDGSSSYLFDIDDVEIGHLRYVTEYVK